MTQEEKAKRYDEALENARKINDEHKAQPFDVMLKVFPELKESEDERIRLELITHCRNTRCVTEEGAERIAKWIAWLEKKELKKIDNEIEIPFGAKDSELQEVTYYIPKGFYAEIDNDKVVIKKGEKPIAWSEEDEKKIDSIIETIRIRKFEHPQLAPVYEGDINWLKSLKDRILPQPKQEWSEADEYNQAWLIEHLYGIEDSDKEYEMKCRKMAEWLKSLKDRVLPKQEWSEEDEKMIQDIINDIAIAQEQVYCKSCCEDEINWLKSLRPQNRWKPSEGQLECLSYAIEKAEKDWSPMTNNRIYLTLKALKEQLVKLKETW